MVIVKSEIDRIATNIMVVNFMFFIFEYIRPSPNLNYPKSITIEMVIKRGNIINMRGLGVFFLAYHHKRALLSDISETIVSDGEKSTFLDIFLNQIQYLPVIYKVWGGRVLQAERNVDISTSGIVFLLR